MESSQNLPARNSKQEISYKASEFTPRQRELIKAVGEVNKLVSFPLEVPELVSWAMDIERLYPGIGASRLRFLIDQYKLEELVWDKSKGIQNIFAGLKMVGKSESGYYLKKKIW